MRDVRGEADGVPTGLAEAVLQQADGMPGDGDDAQPVLLFRQQSGPGGVRGHPRGAGVRHPHRDRHQPDGEPDREPVDDLADGRDEALPLGVRLGTGQQQKRRPVGVGELVDDQLRLAYSVNLFDW